MRLHAVFSLEPNKTWVRNTSCVCNGCFNITFLPVSACSGWREVNLTEGIAAENQKASSGKEIIIPDTGDYVAAVYDGNVYMGMVLETDSDDTVFISFLEHTDMMNNKTKFKYPRRSDEIWLNLVDVLCIIPKLCETKRGLIFDVSVIDMVLVKYEHWSRKN